MYQGTIGPTPKVRQAFDHMGVLFFSDLNPDDLAAADEQVARTSTAGAGFRVTVRPPSRPAGIDPARAAEVRSTIEAGDEF
jgi:hypothetical protein